MRWPLQRHSAARHRFAPSAPFAAALLRSPKKTVLRRLRRRDCRRDPDCDCDPERDGCQSGRVPPPQRRFARLQAARELRTDGECFCLPRPLRGLLPQTYLRLHPVRELRTDGGCFCLPRPLRGLLPQGSPWARALCCRGCAVRGELRRSPRPVRVRHCPADDRRGGEALFAAYAHRNGRLPPRAAWRPVRPPLWRSRAGAGRRGQCAYRDSCAHRCCRPRR